MFELEEVMGLVQEDMKHREMLPDGEYGTDLGEREHRRAMARRKEKMTEAAEAFAEARENHAEAKSQLESLSSRYTEQVQFNQKIEAELAKLAELETPENQKTLELLRKLVAVFESLKKQEEEFKAYVVLEKAALEEKVRAAKDMDPEELLSAEDKEIKRRYEELRAKLQLLRQRDSKIKRLIAMVKRKIDAIPSRTELQQYQQQFLELYETVAGRLTETRSYYATYNTLDTQHEYLSKEVKILESISDQYKAAMRSKTSKQNFLTQLQEILTSVCDNNKSAAGTYEQEKERFDNLNKSYLALVEKERQYFKAVKDMEFEARKARQIQRQRRQQKQQKQQQ